MRIPLKTILCPVDFEQNSIAALEIAVKLAERDGATVCVMHVAARPIAPAPLEFPRGWENAAEARLEKIVAEHIGGKAPHQTLVRMGDPAREIARAADDLNADMVVMATHNRSPIQRLLLGSVAEQALRQVRRPLLTVRPELEGAREPVQS